MREYSTPYMKGGHDEFHHLVWRNLGEPGSEPVIWGRQNQPKAPEFDAESALAKAGAASVQI